MRCSGAIQPQDKNVGIHRVTTADGSKAFRIKYIGSEESGLIQVATTTGDIAFEHGDSGSEAADTTVNASGGTPGTIDLSADATTWQAIQILVDLSPNWEFIYDGILPLDASEASGTAKIVNNISDAQCKIPNGYQLYVDRSAALYSVIGVTFNSPSSEPHGSDSQSHNEINAIKVNLTYASGTHTVNIYRVNDVSGVATLLDSFAAGATTVDEKIPSDGSQGVVYAADTERLVMKQVSVTTEPSVFEYEIQYSQFQFAPSVRSGKMWSTY